MVGDVIRPAILEGNGFDLVIEARFLARPAQPDVTDIAAWAGGHPVIGPDRQRGYVDLSMILDDYMQLTTAPN